MTCIIRKVPPSGLVKSVFGILFGAGGVVSPVPVAYVTISQTAYETLMKKTWSNGSPICSGQRRSEDGKGVRYLVVYDSLKWKHDPGKEEGVFRFLQGVDVGGGKFDGNEISDGPTREMQNPAKPGERGTGKGVGLKFGTGTALAEYGVTNIYEDGGSRECGEINEREEEIIKAVSELNRRNSYKKVCTRGILTIRCEISVADGGILNWKDGDRPVITYSVF